MVATTVIEVGVNVPDMQSVMINWECLNALVCHNYIQLRGALAVGADQSFCI